MVTYLCPTIAFCDTDAGGVVYHTKYLELAERARADLLLSLGLSNQALWLRGFVFAVTDMTVKYHRPAILGDVLSIQTTRLHLSHVRIHLQQDILRQENLLVSLRIHLACLSKEGKPKAMDAPLYASLASLQKPEG
ncbi:MAG: YbgC/FadM family acyl-CoA thioesterase [Alphaproteobacteria bacterium]